MAGVFTKIPINTFKEIASGGGMLLSHWNPADPYEISEAWKIGATTGGMSVNASFEYIDYGEDIDNCPKNTKELKRVDDFIATISGTLVTTNKTAAKLQAAHADIVGDKIVLRTDIDVDNDFNDLYLLIDYSDINVGSGAGFVAIHIMDALSTGGFQVQTQDKNKTQFAFEFTAHFSIDAQDTVPFEVWVKEGTSGTQTPEIQLDRHAATVVVGEDMRLNAIRLIPADSTVTWTSSATGKANVDDGEVTGVAAGSAIITASITVDGVAYSDTCTVVVEAAT